MLAPEERNVIPSVQLPVWLTGRYVPDTQKLIFRILDKREKTADQIIQELTRVLTAPQLEKGSLTHPEIVLPPEILRNNARVRDALLQQVGQLSESLQKSDDPLQAAVNFVIANHESLKWALNEWLLASPGMTLEIWDIKPDLDQEFLRWLHERFQVEVGSPTLHRHVISNGGRKRLREMGFVFDHDHWDESYYKQGMNIARQILEDNPQLTGIESDGSWIYNPDNFQMVETENGPESFVRFSFLQDDRYTGERFFLEEATGTQKQFALRNSQLRQRLHSEGNYTPKVYGVFYPRERVIQNAGFFRE